LGELDYNNTKGAFFSALVSIFSEGDVDTFAYANHAMKQWKEIGRGWEKRSLPCF